MASAQLLKIAHGVDDKVKRVDARVKDVDNKVDEVINGAQTVFSSLSPIP
jgi:archaellum component FlaC